MRIFHKALILAATAATLGTGCARYTSATASGDVIDAADAAQTVVLHVDNQNPQSMELRTIINGKSQFIGSVQGNDSTTIALEPNMLPTALLYVLAIPADGHGRAIAGPLGAGKGDRVMFTVMPELDQSHAHVVR